MHTPLSRLSNSPALVSGGEMVSWVIENVMENPRHYREPTLKIIKESNEHKSYWENKGYGEPALIFHDTNNSMDSF